MQEPNLPRHVAIIMDGNGRWAKQRHLPRIAGHKKGLQSARQAVEYCVKNNVTILSLFVFSSENWRRPQDEVSYLMQLFMTMLQRDAKKLHEKNIRCRVIGDRSRFSDTIQQHIAYVENLTAQNTGLTLVLAANYGGQWDIAEAMRKVAVEVSAGKLKPEDINSHTVSQHISLHDLPHPDLLIRTGGEMRISNFFLWQLAYTECYFTDVFWPDFSEADFDKALAFFSKRERRFGYISEQLNKEELHA